MGHKHPEDRQAVALRDKPPQDPAPRITAKGRGYRAERVGSSARSVSRPNHPSHGVLRSPHLLQPSEKDFVSSVCGEVREKKRDRLERLTLSPIQPRGTVLKAFCGFILKIPPGMVVHQKGHPSCPQHLHQQGSSGTGQTRNPYNIEPEEGYLAPQPQPSRSSSSSAQAQETTSGSSSSLRCIRAR